MKNKNILLIGLTVLIIIAVLVASVILSNNSTKTTDANDDDIYNRAISESEKVNDDEMRDFISITVDEYLDLYNGSEKELVLVGRSGCQYCQIANPIIQNIMYINNLDIKYLSTDTFTQESEEKFMDSNELLNSFATPLLLVVQDGEIINSLEGLTDRAGYNLFFEENGFIK